MARPRWVRDYRQPARLPIAPKLLERNFTAAAPNRIWLADITYIETDQGWLYLATVMDLYSRRIVGWARWRIFACRAGAGSSAHGHLGAAAWLRPDHIPIAAFNILGGVSQCDAVRRLPGLDEPQADCYDNARWRASSTAQDRAWSITGIMQRGRTPDVLSSPTSKASTIERVATQHRLHQPDEMELKAA